jgi:hypothetical protein
MAEATKGGLDPVALAAALLVEAETARPAKGTIKETLQTPEVFNAVKELERKGWQMKDIAEALKKHGLDASPGTIKKRWQEVKREAKGDTDGKAQRKSKTTTPRTTAGTAEGIEKNTTAGGGATSSKPAEGTSTAKPTEPPKGNGGGASKKPTMAANIDPSEL